MFGLNSLAFAGEASCLNEATKLAPKLFAFHYGESPYDKPYFEAPVQVAPLKAPSGNKWYEVDEVNAVIGKMGYFRLRFIFSVSGSGESTTCGLMGQEILDLSRE